MNDSVKKPYLLVLSGAFVLALVAVIFRTVLLFTAFDPSLGHFESGAAADLLFPLLFVIAAVFFAMFGFIARAELTQSTLECTIPVVFASAFGAVATVVWVITQIGAVFESEGVAGLIFGILMLVSALGLSLYFVLVATGAGDNRLRVLTGISTVLFCVFYMLYTYFDTALTLNSPIKMFDQLTFLCFTLFFIAECRFRFGTAHSAVYLPLGLFSMMMAAANALPAMLYALDAGAPLAGGVMHDFMVLSLFLYATARLCAAVGPKKQLTPESTYAAEIAEGEAHDYRPDTDTHIVSHDPDQQEFNFEDELEPIEDTPVEPVSEQEDGEDGEFDTTAQTTLDFKRPNT